MMRSKLLLAGGCVALLFLLSSCITMDADITLDGDAMATGTMKIEMSKELAMLVGITSKEMLEKEMADNGDAKLPKGVSATISENDKSYIISAKLLNSPLDDDGWKAEKLADGTIKFTFKNENTATSDLGFADFAGKIKMTITFPGSVISSSPEFVKVDNRTVKLASSFTDPLDVYVVSKINKSRSISVGGTSIPLVPLVLGLIVLSAITVGKIRERKKKSPLLPPEPDEPPLQGTIA